MSDLLHGLLLTGIPPLFLFCVLAMIIARIVSEIWRNP